MSNASRHRAAVRAGARAPMEPFERRDWPARTVTAVLAARGCDTVNAELATCRRGYVNNRYRVLVTDRDTPWGRVEHWWVERHDGDRLVAHWAELQRIKNEIAGPERVAIEVYPRESELIDSLNMYHLWLLPEGFALPFGLEPARRVATAPGEAEDRAM